MILILTDQFDKHADIVIEKLRCLGNPPYRLNLDVESLQKTSATYDGNRWIIQTYTGELYSDQVKCVWLRRPFVELTLQEQNNTDTDFRIWRGEWNKTLLGFYTFIRSVPWLNPLNTAYRAENKYLQMEIAARIGFRIPPIIVSNNKNKLLNFSHHYDHVAMKIMSQELYQDSYGDIKGIYVNKITADDLEDFGDLSENPIVLQAYIPKEFEVRYTVIGSDHHVCRINSQMSNIANIDWRRYDIPHTPHVPIEPPPIIRDRVTELLKVLDIDFGALDFIISPSQDWYFLEVNAIGQWLWIEDLAGLNISGSIARWLVNSQKEKQK
jgi:glutathione synthase/RimK-type ligase-like ATP-grasp enzyme